MPPGVARAPCPHALPAEGAGRDLRGERHAERAAAPVAPPVGAHENVDDPLARRRLVEDGHRGGDDLGLLDGELGSLESRAIGRPPVTDDTAQPVDRGRYQSLKPDAGVTGGRHEPSEGRVLAHVTGPGKGPLDEEIAPVAAGAADGIDAVRPCPARAEHAGDGGTRALGSDADGHRRHPNGARAGNEPARWLTSRELNRIGHGPAGPCPVCEDSWP